MSALPKRSLGLFDPAQGQLFPTLSPVPARGPAARPKPIGYKHLKAIGIALLVFLRREKTPKTVDEIARALAADGFSLKQVQEARRSLYKGGYGLLDRVLTPGGEPAYALKPGEARRLGTELQRRKDQEKSGRRPRRTAKKSMERKDALVLFARQGKLPLEEARERYDRDGRVTVSLPSRRTAVDLPPIASEDEVLVVIDGMPFTHGDVIKLSEGMLIDALLLIRKVPNGKGAREAMEWVVGNDDPPLEPVPFSFRFCCGLMGLDFEDLRAGLLDIWEHLRSGHVMTPVPESEAEADDEELPDATPAERREMLASLRRGFDKPAGAAGAV